MKPATWEDIERVARNLCPRHRKNACLLSFSDDPVEALAYLKTTPFIGGTVWNEDGPVAVAGAVITHPNAASTFFYGTDRWPDRLLEITRFYKHELKQRLRRMGINRVSVMAPAGDPEGERWKRLSGYQYEATLKQVGKNGEDFCVFATFLNP